MLQIGRGAATAARDEAARERATPAHDRAGRDLAPWSGDGRRSPPPLRVWKMQAVGNDFLLVDASDGDCGAPRSWSSLARELCARKHGLGADGLLVVSHGAGASPRMRMWNPDGTEDFCGNGLRCAARYLYDRRLVGGRSFSIDALGASIGVEISRQRSATPSIALDLGPPRLRPSTIPMKLDNSVCPVIDHPIRLGGRTLRIDALSTGSTHSVIFGRKPPSDAELLDVGRRLERHPLFPARTSVLWVTVKNRRRLQMRIWERGVGETLACGSGACAAAVAARLRGLTRGLVTVDMAGGAVQVAFEPGGSVTLIGGAQYVCCLDVLIAASRSDRAT
jgi:diaminopimelate epimerase